MIRENLDFPIFLLKFDEFQSPPLASLTHESLPRSGPDYLQLRTGIRTFGLRSDLRDQRVGA